MIIRAGEEIRRLLEVLLKSDDSFLLQLAVVSHLLEELIKGKDLGAMWEAKLVVGTAKGEVIWETWETRLAWEMLEAKGAE